MSENTWMRDTSGLAAHAQSRKEHKRNAVENALTALLREQKLINFNTETIQKRVLEIYLPPVFEWSPYRIHKNQVKYKNSRLPRIGLVFYENIRERPLLFNSP
jgi:hypothetical protein